MIDYQFLPRPDGVADPATRMDPFYDGAWRVFSGATWLASPSVKAAIASGTALRPDGLDGGLPPNPFAQVRSGDRRAALLSAARMWGTLTVEQVSAITGYGVKGLLRDARSLFRAGLIDLGVGIQPGLGRAQIDEKTLVAVRYWGDAKKQLRGATPPQYLSITMDRRWRRPSASSRHNALTAEVCLRIATWMDVRAVVGEALSFADDLFGLGAGGSQRIVRPKRADATIIRHDGLKIALETTTSASTGLKAKIESWAQYLAANPGSDVVVLFLCAPPIDGTSDDPSAAIRRAMKAATARYPGTLHDPTSQRMAIVNYTDFFPSRGVVDERFFALEALMDGRVVSLLDHQVPRARPSGSMEGLSLLAGLPWWQRKASIDPMGPIMARMGATITTTHVGFGQPDYPLALRPVGYSARNPPPTTSAGETSTQT